jgi:cell division protein FtsI (penicillin-binding protein 3)
VRPDVIAAARESMIAVTTEGTAKDVFKDFPFPVAGKTGTAHVAGGSLKYTDGVYQASFAGFFPADNPQYSCIVVIRTKPHAPLHYGGQLAAPVFKEIATELFAMYAVKSRNKQPQSVPDSTAYVYKGLKTDLKNVLGSTGFRYSDSSGSNSSWASLVNNNYKPVAKDAEVSTKMMPDVRHMTLKDAIYALEASGLKVIAKGKGKVVVQDILPGTAITKRTTVTILLN